MRQGNSGSWYCATKMPDGGWCPHKEYDNSSKPSSNLTSSQAPDTQKLIFNTLETIIKEIRAVQLKIEELKSIALEDKEPYMAPRPKSELPF